MIDSRPATYEHIQTVQRFMGRLIRRLMKRAEVHDQSKLVSPEVEVFDVFTPKLANSTYGSDEYKGFLAAMKPALDHHYAANSHHPEHYAIRGPGSMEPGTVDGKIAASGKAIAQMSLLDIVEMLADWKAASMRHADGDIRKSIEINQKRFGYSDELKQILLNSLLELENEP